LVAQWRGRIHTEGVPEQIENNKNRGTKKIHPESLDFWALSKPKF
jgi:hypothetical protein